jgi:hypothetical protein
VPYSHTALNDLIGTSIRQSCSESTTELLAAEAFRNCASNLLLESSEFESLANSNIFGIACSAALVSSSPKKGSHRCHVSAVTSSTSDVWSIQLAKGFRTREEEDYVCSRLILDAIFATCSVPLLPQDYLQADQSEFISSHRTDRLDGLFEGLLGSQIGALFFVKKSAPSPSSSARPSLLDEFDVFDDITIPATSLIYSGSFNPFHDGHANLTRAALSELGDGNLSTSTQRPVVFEIAMVNADKPSLSKDEIISRLMAFSSCGTATMLLRELGVTNFAVAVTSRPLFSTKVELFPGCHFLMGTDTLSRLFDPKYYENSRENMIVATGKMLQSCRLIVGGRATAAGEFLTPQAVLADLDLPSVVTRNIASIEEAAFRCDISSTMIRNQQREKEAQLQGK